VPEKGKPSARPVDIYFAYLSYINVYIEIVAGYYIEIVIISKEMG